MGFVVVIAAAVVVLLFSSYYLSKLIEGQCRICTIWASCP